MSGAADGARPRSTSSARLSVVAAAVLWGTTGTAQALGPDDASSLAVGAARNVTGGLVLLAVAAARARICGRQSTQSVPVRPQISALWRSARELPARPLVLAAAATAAYQLCFFGGVRLAGVAVGTVVGVGSGPVWGGLLGWVGRGERPGRRWAAATALALVGAALLATSTGTDGEPVDAAGILLALGAGLTYAAFALWSKELTDEHDPDVAMTWVFALSAVMLLPVGLVAGVGPLLTADGAAMVAWLGVVSLAVAYLLFGRGIAGVAVATATTLSLAEPATATVLGITLLDEQMTGEAAAGMALVLTALLILLVKTRARTAT